MSLLADRAVLVHAMLDRLREDLPCMLQYHLSMARVGNDWMQAAINRTYSHSSEQSSAEMMPPRVDSCIP